MPDVTAYLSNYPTIPGISQVVMVGRYIDEKPTSIITVSRATGNLSSGNYITQIVRLEPVGGSVETPQESSGTASTLAVHYVVVHGYKGHPTAPDTDLKRGDRFVANGIAYDVINVIETFADRLLASAKVSE